MSTAQQEVPVPSRPTPRRRTARAGGALLLASLAGPFFGAPAAMAATTTENASNGGYYNQAGLTAPEGVPVAPPNPAASGDGVAFGDLAVASKSPTDKMSFLLFDMVDVEPGSTINSATVSVPLSTASGSTNFMPAPEKVQGCAVGPEGFGEADAASYELAPSVLCETFKVTAAASGPAYTFDVTALAQKWLDEENNGLALVPAVTTPFQVTFKPFDQATLTVDATPPAEEEETAEPTTPVDTPDLGGAVDTGSTDAGTGDSGVPGFGSDSGLFGGDTTTDGGSGLADAPVLSAPLESGTTDVVAGGAVEQPVTAPSTTALQPVATSRRAVSASLGSGFWLVLVTGVVGLAALSLVLGDSRPRLVTTATPAGRADGVAARLQSRQRFGGPAARPL